MANGTAIAPATPTPLTAAPPKRDNTLLLLLLAGGGGYLAYRYWWLPKKLQEQLAIEAGLRMQQQPGLSPEGAMSQALASVCTVGGSVYGAKYGIPPSEIGNMCQALAPGAIALLKSSPAILKKVIDLHSYGVKSIIDLHKYAVKGALDIAAMPVKTTFSLLAKGTSATYGAVKDVTTDIYGGTKTVVRDVVVKPVTTVVQTGEKVLSKLNPFNW